MQLLRTQLRRLRQLTLDPLSTLFLGHGSVSPACTRFQPVPDDNLDVLSQADKGVTTMAEAAKKTAAHEANAERSAERDAAKIQAQSDRDAAKAQREADRNADPANEPEDVVVVQGNSYVGTEPEESEAYTPPKEDK